MKLLSLNIWGGREYSELIDYLEKTIPEIDVYCFQEVFDTKDDIIYSHKIRADIWEELAEIFLDYHRFYYPAFAGIDDAGSVPYNLTSGLGIFVKRELEVNGNGDIFTYRNRFDPLDNEMHNQPVNLQYINIIKYGKPMHIYNFHGIWYPGEKMDTPERIKQSEKLVEFISKQKGLSVLCGDFNLMPETKSVAILDNKFRNLIKEFNIRTTRSWLNPYRGTRLEQAFADYVFTSNNLKITDFKVPDISVSDHLPMIVEFEL